MRDYKGAEQVTILNLKEDTNKSFGAEVRPKKGGDKETAELMIRDIIRAGLEHEDLIIKSDQEHSMHEVIREVQRLRKSGSTILEHSPVNDHQANGVAERAVQEVEGLVRTHHSHLEERLKAKVPATHAVMTWLVLHCVNLLNCFLVGPDGKTPMKDKR